MASLHLATLNVENLLARYEFTKNTKEKLIEMFSIEDFVFMSDAIQFTVHKEKDITAKLIQKINADVICLQEVEGLEVLEYFNRKFLNGMYSYAISIHAHDPRMIDTAVLSKFPFGNIRSNRHVTSQKNNNISFLFPRDCLEVEVLVPEKKNPKKIHSLWLFCNHFTSMSKGRERSYYRREEQSRWVINRIDELYKSVDYRANFVVLGDFNDKNDVESAILPLIKHPNLENIVERLPIDEQWTHYYAKEETYNQLDYLMIPKPLMAYQKPDLRPTIHREGIPRRALKHDGDRFEDVGDNYPKASDHAAVSIHINLF